MKAMKVSIAIAIFGLAFGSSRATTCGNFPSFMTGDRIVGGVAASSPIPWQVSVRNGQSGYGHFCGGTILDEKTVMCAAHCFTKGQSMSGYYITAGVTNRNDGSGQTIEIANGVWNAAMPYSGNNNDFIILKLKSALTFNNDVGAACLPEPNYAPDLNGQTCFVSGWGTLESGANSLPTNLQWVAVPTVTNQQCSNSYNGITDSMICAGFPQGGKDSCQGDSGGPFICRDNEKAVLTGVVSFGMGCALPNYPGVYARVTAVLDWVKENMESGSGSPTTSAPSPTTGAPSPTTASPPSGCGSPQWVGDQYCDDENNNAECNYDGGDCCNNNASGWDNYCSVCECLENQTTTTTSTSTTTPSSGGCGFPDWAEDNYCDDENNNAECNFDGGACCNPVNGWTNYCTDCKCKDPSVQCVDKKPAKRCNKWKNKGRCNKPWVAKNCMETCGYC